MSAAGRGRASAKPASQGGGSTAASKPRKASVKQAASRQTEATEPSAARLIDQRIRELAGWRGETLARMRALILAADPEVTEEWKWSNPVWSHHGIICTGEAYKKAVKLTFARGASVPDPQHLFNSSLEGNLRRAIDIHEGETVDAKSFKALIAAAVAANAAAGRSSPKARAKSGAAARAAAPTRARRGKNVVLLAGGNPQIAKGDGDAPVQAYIAALPGWKHDVGRRLDALVVQAVPGVRKAVKWNSPFYGAGEGWFLSFHMFTRYVKITFFKGAALRPVPPGGSKHPEVRYLDVHEGELDEAQLTSWVKQAAALPGWAP